MRFGPVPLEQAQGKVLGHNVSGDDGRRAFRKGHVLTADDLQALAELGRASVYVAELAPDDVGEDQAAWRAAVAAAGPGLELSGPSTGRVNLRSASLGVLRIEREGLEQLNSSDGITLATLPAHSTVRQNQIAATVKVIPFAVPEALVRQVEQIAGQAEPLLRVDLISASQVGLVLSAAQATRERTESQFAPVRERVEALGSQLARIDHVDQSNPEAAQQLSDALNAQLRAGMQLIVLAGDTAIMDEHDIAPRAVKAVGGQLEALGAPVDPGNLLMLAYVGDVPVLGAPGCARSRKVNVIDWVLPRLLAGERLKRSDIAAMGHGGLLDDLPERPLPRSSI